jgi:hypothetical protein
MRSLSCAQMDLRVNVGVATVGSVQDATIGRSTRVVAQGSSGAKTAVFADGPRRNVTLFLQTLQDPNRYIILHCIENLARIMSLPYSVAVA